MAQEHQDDAAVQQLEQALSGYRPGGGGSHGMGMAAAAGGSAAGGSAAAGAAGAAAGGNICEIWGRIKSIVTAGIGVLKLLPFGWAKGLATALQELSNALTVMCG